MGKYDDISEARLKGDLVAFAHLLLRLEREGTLLASPADLQMILGELRRKIFAFEVKAPRLPLDGSGAPASAGDTCGPEFAGPGGAMPEETRTTEPGGGGAGQDGAGRNAMGSDPADSTLRESWKVVREAMKRKEEMIREWDGRSGDGGDERD